MAGPSAWQALLRRSGGSASAAELGDALEPLCPEVVARQREDEARDRVALARGQTAWMAGRNARCADPWPGLRAARQGTAAYSLFEGGGYYVHDDRDTTEEAGGDVLKAVGDGLVHAAGSSAAIVTYGENGPMCLTVKALRTAPPSRPEGWDRVAEVGLVSRSGRLVVPPYPEAGDSGALGPLPNLAVGGPGRYRLRVHAGTGRGRSRRSGRGSPARRLPGPVTGEARPLTGQATTARARRRCRASCSSADSGASGDSSASRPSRRSRSSAPEGVRTSCLARRLPGCGWRSR